VPFATTFKRVENIIKDFSRGAVDPALFESEEEVNLHHAYNDIRDKALKYIAIGDYSSSLAELAALKEPVDRFFESVLVMAKDEKVKLNRLSLLEEISALFHEIADFSYISTEN
jgi:glycyl-tRNA synthetase beta chain